MDSDSDSLRDLYEVGLNAGASADPLAGEVPELDGYEVQHLLGQGGMGVVYLARNLRLNREVAIKVLHAGTDSIEAERLKREGKVLAQISHPNIVGVHDLLMDQYERPNLVLEYVEGGDLAARLSQGGMSQEEALRVFVTIVQAVQHAHSHGVLHRDLKPANILFDSKGNAKVADFGLASLGENTFTHNLTLSGTTAGTEAYMSPEQKKAQPLDARSDIYSLGVILYEVLSGRQPHGVFAALPDKNLDRVVRRCLQERAEDRYPDCESLLADIKGSGSGNNVRTPAMILGVVLILLMAWLLRDRLFSSDPDPTHLIAPGLTESDTGAPAVAPPLVKEADQVDLLERMAGQSATLRRRGTWTVANGVLSTARGAASQAWIEIPFEPGDSYDLELVAIRISGQDSLPLFFPTAAGPVALELDAWRMGIAGFQNVDGQDLRQSGQSFEYRYRNGEPCRLVLQVRPDAVSLRVDGEERLRLELAGRRLSIPEIWQLPGDLSFAIGAWEADARFERLAWSRVEDR